MEGDNVTGEDVLLAARYGDLDDLRQLLDAPGLQLNPNATDANGSTALHLAAANGHEAVVAFLLTRCRRDLVDARNSGGNTALHWAALNGHLAVVKLLLEFGAHPQACRAPRRSQRRADARARAREQIKNVSGRTPLDEGMQRQHDEVCVAIVQSPRYRAEEDDDGAADGPPPAGGSVVVTEEDAGEPAPEGHD